MLEVEEMGDKEGRMWEGADCWAMYVTLGVSPTTLGVTEVPTVAGRLWQSSVQFASGAVVDADTYVTWDHQAGGYCYRRIDHTGGGKLIKIPDVTPSEMYTYSLHAKEKWMVWSGDSKMILMDLHVPDPYSTSTHIVISHFPWALSYLFSSVHWPNELALAVQMKADPSSVMFIIIDIERTFATKNLEILTQFRVANPEATDEWDECCMALLLKKKADNTRVIVLNTLNNRVLHIDSATGDVVPIGENNRAAVSQLDTCTFCVHPHERDLSQEDGDCAFTQLWECGNTAAGPVRTIEHEPPARQVVGGSGFLFVVCRDTIAVSDADSGVVVVTLSLSLQHQNQLLFIDPDPSLL
ncbi:hypothetical protein Pelo_8282 [Pelomyxa schiedti]|nr:hypothetical protein Pelo_8282 [Pelomyxa schiedti]